MYPTAVKMTIVSFQKISDRKILPMFFKMMVFI